MRSRSRQREPEGFESRFIGTIATFLTVLLLSIAVLVAMRMERASTAHSAALVARVAQAAATASDLPAIDAIELARFRVDGSRRDGAAGVAVPSAADLAHAGDARFARHSEHDEVTVAIRGGRVDGEPIVAVARSLLPASLRSDLRWLQITTMLPLGLVLAVLALVMFGRLFVPMRRQLDAVSLTADRLSVGDLSARMREPGDDVAPLARSLNSLADRLSDEDSRRGRYVSQVSHDLRSPLTVIRAFACTLRPSLPDGDDRRRIEVIEEEVDRIGAMVDDLLGIGRVRAGGLTITPQACDVAAIVRRACELRGPLALARNVEVRLCGDAEAIAFADPLRVAQIADNLLDNALAHAPSGSSVEVSVRGGDEVVIVVQDDGPGIPAAELPYIFEPFMQGARRAGAAGLGLAITSELTRAQGGTITADSPAGGGARLIVTLPVDAPVAVVP